MTTFDLASLKALGNVSPFKDAHLRRPAPLAVGQIRRVSDAEGGTLSDLVVILDVPPPGIQATVALVDSESELATVWDLILPSMNGEIPLVTWPDSRTVVWSEQLQLNPVLRELESSHVVAIRQMAEAEAGPTDPELAGLQRGRIVPLPGDLVWEYRKKRIETLFHLSSSCWEDAPRALIPSVEDFEAIRSGQPDKVLDLINVLTYLRENSTLFHVPDVDLQGVIEDCARNAPVDVVQAMMCPSMTQALSELSRILSDRSRSVENSVML